MGKVIKLAALALLCAVLVFPVWLMVINSFTESQILLRMPPRLFPPRPTLINYQQIFRMTLLWRWFANSLLVVTVIVAGGIFINGAAGYVFRVSSAPWLKVLFWALMAPIFVTRITIIIAQFVIVGKLKLNGLPSVVLIPLYWPAGIFLFRNFFQSIPESFLESARLDGARESMIFLKIVLPLSKPIIGAAIVFLGMSALGDYIWQMLNLQRAELQTFLVGLVNSTINVNVVDNLGYDLAVGTFLFIPYILIFASSSRYFMKGLTMGGIRW